MPPPYATTPPLRAAARCSPRAALLAAPDGVVLTTPGPAEARRRPTNRADVGAGWLGPPGRRRQPPDDRPVRPVDYGQTADVVHALYAARSAGARPARPPRRSSARPRYTGGGDAAEYYAGAYAKLLVVATARGTDPARSAPRSGPTWSPGCAPSSTARCAPAAPPRTAAASATRPVRRLQQRDHPVSRPDRPGARHPAPARRGRPSSSCSVSSATRRLPRDVRLRHLHRLGRRDRLRRAGAGHRRRPGRPDAAADAGSWLVERQHRDGSFSGNGVRNANSTALAAQALEDLGRDKRPRRPAATCAACRRLRRQGVGPRIGPLHREVRRRPGPVHQPGRPGPRPGELGDMSKAGSVRGLPRLAC